MYFEGEALNDADTRDDATAVVVRAWSDDESEARGWAERVERYLVEQRVDADRMGSVGLAGERPAMGSVLLMTRP